MENREENLRRTMQNAIDNYNLNLNDWSVHFQKKCDEALSNPNMADFDLEGELEKGLTHAYKVREAIIKYRSVFSDSFYNSLQKEIDELIEMRNNREL